MRKVVDVHVHMGISSTLQVAGGAEDVIRIMDENEIDQSIISPIPGYVTPRGVADSMEENNNIAEAVRRWPDRYPRGLGVIEPRHGKAGLPEVDRVLGDLGLHGLMFHNDFNGVNLDDPRMFAIIEKAAKYKDITIMVHTAQQSMIESPYQLIRLANAFPEVTFLDAHPMMFPAQLSATILVAKKCPNVYFDTCLTYHHLWPIETAVKEIGADRILFGSDNPYFTKCIDKVIVEWAEISEEDKDLIFYKNAQKLFAL
jgi:predicted TIM-barrel fold metal-dependent hydrolase